MTEWLHVLKETIKKAKCDEKDKKKNKRNQQTDGSKHPWSKQEDELLKKLIKKHGPSDWSELAKGVSRTSVLTFLAVSLRNALA